LDQIAGNFGEKMEKQEIKKQQEKVQIKWKRFCARFLEKSTTRNIKIRSKSKSSF